MPSLIVQWPAKIVHSELLRMIVKLGYLQTKLRHTETLLSLVPGLFRFCGKEISVEASYLRQRKMWSTPVYQVQFLFHWSYHSFFICFFVCVFS